MLAPGAGVVVGVDPDDDDPPPHAPRVRARTTRPAAAAGFLMLTVSVASSKNMSLAVMRWNGRAMPVDAVIFDWGGTLSVFVEAELVDAWRLVARHLAPDREDEVTEVLVAVEEEFWATTSTHQRSGRLAQLLAAATDCLGLDAAEALLEEAATRHLDAWTPHIRHDPDAGPTLRALREQGARVALLSNTHWPRPFHEHFLERDGLVDLIDARLYTSEMPFQKPHPSAFRAALDAVEVEEPARAVFVGDRPFDDISGAKGVGMKAVLRASSSVPGYDVEPDAVIAGLPELVDLVKRWG
jgi:putative hydrolase of the HAD superfamily